MQTAPWRVGVSYWCDPPSYANSVRVLILLLEVLEQLGEYKWGTVSEASAMICPVTFPLGVSTLPSEPHSGQMPPKGSVRVAKCFHPSPSLREINVQTRELCASLSSQSWHCKSWVQWEVGFSCFYGLQPGLLLQVTEWPGDVCGTMICCIFLLILSSPSWGTGSIPRASGW